MPPRGGRPRREPPESTIVPLRGRSTGGAAGRDGAAAGRTGRSAIGDARRYTPRGRTVRDAGSRDPFRPALELVDGVPAQRSTRTRTAAQRTATVPTRQRTRTTGRRTPPKARPTRAAPRLPRKPRRPPRLGNPT